MEFGRKGAEYFSLELKRDLIELMDLQKVTGFQSGITMGPTAQFPGEEKIGHLFDKAREIANKHHPHSFTVSVGIPFGAQVSLTWQTENKRYRVM